MGRHHQLLIQSLPPYLYIGLTYPSNPCFCPKLPSRTTMPHQELPRTPKNSLKNTTVMTPKSDSNKGSKPPAGPSSSSKNKAKGGSSISKSKTTSSSCRSCIHPLTQHTSGLCQLCHEAYYICLHHNCPHTHCTNCF